MADDQLTYKGFVCADGDKFCLVLKDTIYTESFRTMPISGDDDKFDNVSDFSASVVAVKFFDGTEQISMEDTLNDNIDDIFISIKKTATIQVVAENSVIKIIKNSHKDTLKIWTLVDEYFETKEGKKRLNKYIKKDVWNK